MTDALRAVITEVEPAAALPGPLHGKRLLVKDLIDTAGIRTTYGSKVYAEHVPAATAPAVARLVAAGAVLVGKANLHEFAWGVTSQNPWYGTVQNPRPAGPNGRRLVRRQRRGARRRAVRPRPGTDTGCSIRLPAACCGVVGLKPSWGRIPTAGVFPLCPTFDTVGPHGPNRRRGRCHVVGADRRAAAGAAAGGLDRRAPDQTAVGRWAGPAGEPRGRAPHRRWSLSARSSPTPRSRSRRRTPGPCSCGRPRVAPRHVSGSQRRVRRATCARSSSRRRRSRR